MAPDSQQARRDSRVAPPAQRGLWLVPRFSLRTLLIAITLACLLLGGVLGPMSVELFRAAEVGRQANELWSDGYRVEYQRRPDSYSLWLIRNLWFGRVEQLGQEISSLDCGPKTRDITAIPPIPSIQELRFRYDKATCSSPDFQQPAILSVSYEGERPYSLPAPDIRLLRHYPNVEHVRIGQVPSDTRVVADLAQCAALRRLELSLNERHLSLQEIKVRLNDPSLTERAPFTTKPFDSSVLRGLAHVEELKILKMPSGTDWSFLREMQSLREAAINPTGTITRGTVDLTFRNQPVPKREETPLYHLAELPNLRRVELQSTPAYADDLAILAQSARLEHLKLDHVPEGPGALAGLRAAKSLRSLHLKMSQFSSLFDELGALSRELQALRQLRELSCEYDDLTAEHVDVLASLKQIERLRIEYVGQYSAGQDGRDKLMKLPLEKFPIVRNGPQAVPTANGYCEQLWELANQNRMRREREAAEDKAVNE